MRKVFTVYLFFQIIPGFSRSGSIPEDSIRVVSGEMKSDRPGHVTCAQTCGFHVLQVQSGFRFQRYTYSPFPNDQSYTHHTIIPASIKFGLTNTLELNVNYTNYRTKWYDQWTDATYIGKGSPGPIAGIRYTFLKGHKWVPALALQAGIRYKSPKIDLGFGSEFILATRSDFGKLDVSTSIGLVWWGWDTWQYHKVPNYIPYAVKVSYDFGKVTGFIESFGDLTWPDLAIDGGIAVTIGRDLVLDFSGGCAEGIVISEYWFAEAGFTYRYNFSK